MKILLLIFGLIFPSNSVEITTKRSLSEKIVGVWEIHYSNEGNITYRKVRALANDKGGIEFFADGSLKLKRNAGWCGTPPISYGSYDGTWSVEGNNLTYHYTYWDQSLQNDLKFIEGDERSLTFEVVYRAQVTY